jgi:hypothetical protein
MLRSNIHPKKIHPTIFPILLIEIILAISMGHQKNINHLTSNIKKQHSSDIKHQKNINHLTSNI